MLPLTEDLSQGIDPRDFQAVHDGIVHNPLGGAAYLYEEGHLKPILHQLGLIPVSPVLSALLYGIDNGVNPGGALNHVPTTTTLIIYIGAQPNNSPHAGTIITFATAFVLARDLQTEYTKLRADALASSPADTHLWVDTLRVVVQLDLVDTAPDASRSAEIDGVKYQYSHRATGAMNAFLPDYHKLLGELQAFVENSVEYTVSNPEALMRTPAMHDAIRTLIRDRARIAAELFPTRNASVGPDITSITFRCTTHGAYTLALEDPDDLARLELNTPLRNLARAIVYMSETAESRVPGQPAPAVLHMRVTGADYSGEYQERAFLHQLSELKKVAEPRVSSAIITDPVILYAPLILDWSGAKLSKSLYVKKGAYGYLAEQNKAYLLEFRKMNEKERQVLFQIVDGWMRVPAKRFRSYTVDYLHLCLVKAGLRSNTDR